MNLRTRALGATSALVLSGGMIAFAAPAANAVVTSTGSCSGSVSLTKIVPALTDQTQFVKTAGALTTNSVTLAKNAGFCAGLKAPIGLLAGQPPALMAPTAQASVLSGHSSCAQGATAIATDATNAQAYSLNGKITYTFPNLNAKALPWKLQAYVAVNGFSLTAGPDVLNLSGMIVLGASVGSNISGSVWFNPSVKSVLPDPGYQNSKYTPLTALAALAALGGCADNVVNNVQMPGAAAGSGLGLVLVGDGASPTFGSIATGLAFQQGQ